jgi:hypothetical protein
LCVGHLVLHDAERREAEASVRECFRHVFYTIRMFSTTSSILSK